jgi:hypothetical protein
MIVFNPISLAQQLAKALSFTRLKHTMRSKLLFCFLLSTSLLQAQQAPVWKVSLPENILWQQVTPLGLVVAATSQGLYGIDPDKGGCLEANESCRCNLNPTTMK